MEYLGLTARGFAMGICNVIPGISGGTMALLTGIYIELIEAIRSVANPGHLKSLLKFKLKDIFTAIRWKFLLAVFLGIGSGTLSLSHFLEWMLETYPVPVWSFFFGLVAASAFVVSKRIHRWRFAHYAGLASGSAAMYIIAGLLPMSTPDTLINIFLSSMLAICAMILPGISGAFILVLLGKYQTMLAALNNREVVVILVFVLGAGAGLISIAQLLGWLFKRYHDQTIVVLIGLMLGSLRRIWPWKALDAGAVQSELLPVNPDVANVLPDFASPEVYLALALAVVAFAIVVVFEALSAKQKSAQTE